MHKSKIILASSLVLLGALSFSGCATNVKLTFVDSGSSPSNRPSDNSGLGNSFNPDSVSNEAELISMIQDAYGVARFGLHRGHEPVQDVLDEVLPVSHEELHALMDSGKNLATIADETGVGAKKLIAALVDSWAIAIEDLVDFEEITEAEADAYRAALTKAFTFKVNWDGKAKTPTFTGI